MARKREFPELLQTMRLNFLAHLVTWRAWPAHRPLGGRQAEPAPRPGGARPRRRPAGRRPPAPGPAVGAPLRPPGEAARTGGAAPARSPADRGTGARRPP